MTTALLVLAVLAAIAVTPAVRRLAATTRRIYDTARTPLAAVLLLTAATRAHGPAGTAATAALTTLAALTVLALTLTTAALVIRLRRP